MATSEFHTRLPLIYQTTTANVYLSFPRKDHLFDLIILFIVGMMKKVILCIINVLHHHLCPNHSVHTEVDLGPASMLYLTFPHMVRNHQYGYPYLNLSQKNNFFDNF